MACLYACPVCCCLFHAAYLCASASSPAVYTWAQLAPFPAAARAPPFEANRLTMQVRTSPSTAARRLSVTAPWLRDVVSRGGRVVLHEAVHEGGAGAARRGAGSRGHNRGPAAGGC